MPILRKESEIFPPDLFAMSFESLPWEIVHVRSRQEKALARLLATRSHPFYLPQLEKRIRRAGRVFTSHLPLFPGYLFIRQTPATRQLLWSSGAISRVICVDDQGLLDRELRQIRTLEEAGASLVPRLEIVPGDPVRITEGVFSGYTGIFLKERDVYRVVVSITALQRSVVAELPRETVRPVRPRL